MMKNCLTLLAFLYSVVNLSKLPSPSRIIEYGTQIIAIIVRGVWAHVVRGGKNGGLVAIDGIVEEEAMV